MSTTEIVLDFENVSVEAIANFRKAVEENKGAVALSCIKPAIVSYGGKPFSAAKLKSRDAIGIVGAALREMKSLTETLESTGIVIDLDGWYIEDQDAYYKAMAEADYESLNLLFAMVVQEGPGLNSAGVWVKDVAQMSFEDFVRLNKAVSKEVSESFSEGN